MQIIKDRLKELNLSVAEFCTKHGYRFSDFGSKQKTAQSKLDWLNRLLDPLDLEAVVQKKDMSSKEDVIKKAEFVRHQLAYILSDQELIGSEEARDAADIVIFTKLCPFSEFKEHFINTRSFPRGRTKYQREPLYLRLVFWDLFIFIAGQCGTEMKASEIIEYAAFQADNAM